MAGIILGRRRLSNNTHPKTESCVGPPVKWFSMCPLTINLWLMRVENLSFSSKKRYNILPIESSPKLTIPNLKYNCFQEKQHHLLYLTKPTQAAKFICMNEESKEMPEYLKERCEALLSSSPDNPEKIQAYFLKYVGFMMPVRYYEVAFHKAVSGTKGLPMDFRRKSRQYLDDNSYESFDDGELD